MASSSLTSVGASRLVVPSALRAPGWRDLATATSEALRDSCTTHLGSGGFGSVMRVCSTKIVERGRSTRREVCMGCVAMKTPVPGADAISVNEAVVAERLTAALAGTDAADHVIKHLSHVADPTRAGNPNAVWMTMELVTPVEVARGATVLHLGELVEKHYDVFASLPEKAWKALWVQVLGTLAQLRRVVPGFQHNDIKPDNVALVAWQHGRASCRQVAASGAVLMVPPQAFGIKLLDLGLVTAEDPAFTTLLGLTHWDAMPPEAAVGGCVGVGTGTPMFDVQRAFASVYDLVTRAAKEFKKSPPSWWRRFVDFAERWVAPGLIKDDDPTRNMLDATLVPLRNTPECTTLKADARTAADVLDDPYFAEFHAEEV